jgi:hypothetical protein
MEIRAIRIWGIPTMKQVALKFRDKLRENFTCSDETEMVPSINSEETVEGPVYSEEDIIQRTFNVWR